MWSPPTVVLKGSREDVRATGKVRQVSIMREGKAGNPFPVGRTSGCGERKLMHQRVCSLYRKWRRQRTSDAEEVYVRHMKWLREHGQEEWPDQMPYSGMQRKTGSEVEFYLTSLARELLDEGVKHVVLCCSRACETMLRGGGKPCDSCHGDSLVRYLWGALKKEASERNAPAIRKAKAKRTEEENYEAFRASVAVRSDTAARASDGMGLDGVLAREQIIEIDRLHGDDGRSSGAGDGERRVDETAVSGEGTEVDGGGGEEPVTTAKINRGTVKRSAGRLGVVSLMRFELGGERQVSDRVRAAVQADDTPWNVATTRSAQGRARRVEPQWEDDEDWEGEMGGDHFGDETRSGGRRGWEARAEKMRRAKGQRAASNDPGDTDDFDALNLGASIYEEEERRQVMERAEGVGENGEAMGETCGTEEGDDGGETAGEGGTKPKRRKRKGYQSGRNVKRTAAVHQQERADKHKADTAS